MRSDKVLVWMKPSFLGDAVLATPLLDALIEENMAIAVLAGRSVMDLLACRASKVRFIEAGPLTSVMPVIREARRLRQMRFGTVLLLNRSFRSAFAARLSGIPTRIGFATEGRRALLTHPVPYEKTRSEVDCFLDLVRAMGLRPSDAVPRLCVTEDEALEGERLLGGATVGFQPGARYARKQIPVETLAHAANAVSEAGKTLCLFGGKEEHEHAERLQGMLRRKAVCLVGRTTLRQAMGALAGLRLMVGGDTGLMHVAAGLGCPTLTVFGPTSPAKWGHDYAPHRVIAAPGRDMRRVDPQTLVREALEMLRTSEPQAT